MIRYFKFTEEELKKVQDTTDLENAVSNMLNEGYMLVSVSYKGGCRVTAQHVYHFIKHFND